jgi:hypothetical protein
VAVCGELVTSGAGKEEDPRYCPDCVREAIRWCAQPVTARGCVVSDPRVEIEAICQVHHGSGRLVVRREGAWIVLDARADHRCALVPDSAAVTLLFDLFGEWLR